MVSKFKVIGIYGRVKNRSVVEALKALVGYLQSLRQKIIMDTEAAEALEDASIARISRDELSKRCDLLIVVGGDGSLIHAVHAIVNEEIPVLGINRGRLGFLTDILPSELKKIKSILEGDYLLEKRFLLTATVEYQGRIIGQSNALNEVALIPDSVPHMNEFEIYIDK